MFRKREPTELLPCPFCGNRPRVRESFGRLAISCEAAGCIRPCTWLSGPETTDLAKLAPMWNRRPKRPSQEPPHDPA